MKPLLQYLPLFLAIVAGSVAWGQQHQKIQTLEEAVRVQTTIQQQQAQIKEQAARVDERTKAILESQQRQEELMRILLQRTQ